ncbi:MAG: hypothetical protein ACE5IW_12055 [bacterium]
MTDEDILQGLERLLAELTIEVRYEKGDFRGGLYRYGDMEQMVINKELNIRQKINVLAKELRVKLDLENLYIVPALREVIENASSLGQ